MTFMLIARLDPKPCEFCREVFQPTTPSHRVCFKKACQRKADQRRRERSRRRQERRARLV